MSTRSREVFKLACIKQCRAAGLNIEQTLARIEKMAEWVKTAGLGDVINTVGAFAGKSQSNSRMVRALGLGLPFAGGAAAGILGSKLKGNFLDEEDVKKQEIVDELKRQTALAQQYQRIGGLAPAKS